MAKKKSRSSFVDEAAMQALVRARPELDALTALIRDADTQRRTSIAQARAGRVAIEQGVDQILPRVAATEQALNLDRHAGTNFGEVLNQQRAAAHQDLLDRRSGASVGEAAQRRAAQDTYRSDVGKIRQSQVELTRRIAEEAAVLGGQLRREDVDRRIRLRQQDITADSQAADRDLRQQSIDETVRHNRVTENDPGRGPRPRTGLGSLTQAQENALRDKVEEARSWVRQLNANMDQHQIGDSLTQGRTLRDAAGNEIKVPKLPQTVVSAALDLELAERGQKLSRRNVDRLHRAGVHIPREWLRPARGAAGRQVANAVNKAISGLV